MNPMIKSVKSISPVDKSTSTVVAFRISAAFRHQPVALRPAEQDGDF